MSIGKWGESFLKSGLPLEHLAHVTFRSLDWDCYPSFEYSRRNREGSEVWFEVDLLAKCPSINKGTQLSMLVECKYHDPSRYWFFLPHESSGRWRFDDRVLNCSPYQTLRKPKEDTLLKSSPLVSGAIVVSEDGTKQDNAAYTAIQQVVNGFVPCALDWAFTYNIDFTNVVDPTEEFVPGVDALIPVVVTNAKLYRLKPDITDLDAIRKASGPVQVADEVAWTWCYHDGSASLREQNLLAVRRHVKRLPELVYRFPKVEDAMYDYVDRPNWIAVVNIRSLSAFLRSITSEFMHIGMIDVRTLLGPAAVKKQPRGRRRQT
jgi:hypothetical protein